MAKGILGTKLGMTQIFNESGEVVPVTVVSVEGNVVLQLKTTEVDGYEAVQLGFGDIKEGRQNKPQKVTLRKQTRHLSASLKKSVHQ